MQVILVLLIVQVDLLDRELDLLCLLLGLLVEFREQDQGKILDVLVRCRLLDPIEDERVHDEYAVARVQHLVFGEVNLLLFSVDL